MDCSHGVPRTSPRPSLSLRVAWWFACGACLLWSCLGTALAQDVPDLAARFPGFETLADDPYCFQCMVQQPDGRMVYAGSMRRAFAVVRMNTDGTPDVEFGAGGLAVLPVWGSRHDIATQVLILGDGRIVVAGNAKDFAHSDCYFRSECANFVAVFRLMPDGTLDPSFDSDGRLILRMGEPHESGRETEPASWLRQLAKDPSGDLVVYNGGGREATRIRPDGSLRTIPGRPPAVALDFTVAVEFRHRTLDRFVVTADFNEASALDRDVGAQWVATGYGFTVYPPGSEIEGTVAACRFYGKPESGLDTHLVSVNPDECAALESDPHWILETREAFRVAIPDPVSGRCAQGFMPIYRYWNAKAGVGHRLVSEFLLGWMRNLPDYVPEGWGPEGVAMCAPP